MNNNCVRHDLKKKKRNENERESGFISNTTMHLVSTDRVGNTFHVSLLFIQGYTSTKDNRIFYSAVSLIFVKKKGGRTNRVHGPREKRRNTQEENRYNNSNH